MTPERHSLADWAAELPRFRSPVIHTRDFAMVFGLSYAHASNTLSRLADRGLIVRIATGVWSTTPDVDPVAVASTMFAPHTSYVSMRSAMHHHGMISQVPREIEVIATGNEGVHTTSVGVLAVHTVVGRLITGFEVTGDRKMAFPEKAVFDFLYLQRSSWKLPETETPQARPFSEDTLRSYVLLVRDPSRRTRLVREIDAFMERLDR